MLILTHALVWLNISMSITDENARTNLRYCGQTKCYYAEVELADRQVVIMTSNRQEALQLLLLSPSPTTADTYNTHIPHYTPLA